MGVLLGGLTNPSEHDVMSSMVESELKLIGIDGNWVKYNSAAFDRNMLISI
jgi:hypothetical protein